MTVRNFAVLIGSSALFCGTAVAQQLTLNPYSRYGLGDISLSNSARNMAMGGTSAASFSPFTLNRLNPASAADAVYSTMEASAFGHIAQFKSKTTTEQQVTGSFQNLLFAFPSGRGTTVTLGFAPSTMVGYDINHIDSIRIDTTMHTTSTRYAAQGGVNQVFGGVAHKFFRKRLLTGATFAYNFGNMRYQWQSQIEVINSVSFNTAFIDKSAYVNGAGFQLGAIFTDTLFRKAYKSLPQKERSEKFPLKYRIGASMDYTSSLNGKLVATSSSVSNNGTITDSLIKQQRGSVVVPMRMGVGFEIGRIADWSLGVDVWTQDWSQYRIFDKKETSLQRDIRVAVGGEWIPDFGGKYFSRCAYRAGAYYHRTPLTFNNQPVNDMGITLGAGFLPARGTSSFNLAVMLGKRGNLAIAQPLEEMYMRIQLGVNINERWFVKRVVD